MENVPSLNKLGLASKYMDDDFITELWGIDVVIASFSGSVGAVVELCRAA